MFFHCGNVEVKTNFRVGEVDGRQSAFQAESRDNVSPSLCRLFGYKRMSKTAKWA